MSDSDDRTAARAELVRLVQPATSPALSDWGDGSDVDSALDGHKVATTWAAGAEYAVGVVVLPTERNGRRYLCVRGGTSGGEEPSAWPLRQGAKVADGDDVVWQEDGPAPPNVYDVRAAAHDLWLIRAGRCAGKYDQTIDGQSFRRSQLMEHCLRMAASFAPVTF